MSHIEIPQMIGLLSVMIGTAKAFGWIAKRFGQPSVLGELIAGVVLGASVLGVVEPGNQVLHLLGEIGVVILLFEIGLETDLKKLLQVGGISGMVAIVGVALPFGLGFAVCRYLGLEPLVAVVAGAALTATSVGITARVLADLGRLHEPESRIILGAAVIDDVVGLIILGVVSGIVGGESVTVLGVAKTSAMAFGFLAVVVAVGRIAIPVLIRFFCQSSFFGPPALFGVLLAFGLAWLASVSGSAMIIGAFAAGLLLRETDDAHDFTRGAEHLGLFFVPLFFVTVGAAVDLRVFSPFDPANRHVLAVSGMLIAAAVAGKFAAGYAPVWFKGKKNVIGVGMIPRGEVGLIFAQTGLAAGVFDAGLFSAVTLMVMVTTFLAPPLLKYLLREAPSPA